MAWSPPSEWDTGMMATEGSGAKPPLQYSLMQIPQSSGELYTLPQLSDKIKPHVFPLRVVEVSRLRASQLAFLSVSIFTKA